MCSIFPSVKHAIFNIKFYFCVMWKKKYYSFFFILYFVSAKIADVLGKKIKTGIQQHKHTFPLNTVHSFPLSSALAALMLPSGNAHTNKLGSPLLLTVIAIPFTPQLLSLRESNMKWSNSVIKTENRIRICDWIFHHKSKTSKSVGICYYF